MIDRIIKIRQTIKQDKPLIHCLTNHITINDCANIILASGAKPIMAEHPDEVSEITALSSALAVNLGNITDERMKAILISAGIAEEKNIPVILDPVGVACSTLRLNFAKKFLSKYPLSVIKGNMSEIKALSGLKTDAIGVDVGASDEVSKNTLDASVLIAKKLSQQYRCIVVVTGETDIITDSNEVFLIRNGHKMMSEITGTGCMLTALLGAYCSSKDILSSALSAAAVMGICGEIAAENSRGIGSFKTNFFDEIYNITDETIRAKIKIKRWGSNNEKF